jgi:hypothetical protein
LQTNYQNLYVGYNASNSGYTDIYALGVSFTLILLPLTGKDLIESGLLTYSSNLGQRKTYVDGMLYNTINTMQDLIAWGGLVGRYFTTYYTGNIREVIFYNRSLSDDERTKVEGYLANKWRVTNTLTPFTPISTLRYSYMDWF